MSYDAHKAGNTSLSMTGKPKDIGRIMQTHHITY